MEPISLTTQRLLLRPHDPSDEDAVFTACQDPDIQRWTNLPDPFVREGALRAAQTHSNSLRDTWVGALLPADLGLPFILSYHPADSGLPG
ncbi:GNAT family N-acetyltransferase [Streptomyces sp. NPDC056549]|uniref:GNAT family N-acetyltransferase n=1 Tax=Streptomyces sp. NPDC056549 TaxID=3345864 RepID=UPI003677137F